MHTLNPVRARKIEAIRWRLPALSRIEAVCPAEGPRGEEADLLFADRSGQRNSRKGDRTAWMTINYARLREMGLVARPDHGTRLIQLKRTLPAPHPFSVAKANKSSYNFS